MPDPVLYSQSMAVAAIVSALCVLTMGRLFLANVSTSSTAIQTPTRGSLLLTVSLAAGLLAGYRTLHVRCAWPPINGMDRLLTIVLPLAFGVELLADRQRRRPWVAVFLRFVLAISVARILLHGSIYLGGPRSPWTTAATFSLFAISSIVLATVWWLLNVLSVRSPDGSVPLALAMSSQTTAVTIILSGYVTGGAAALPLTAALLSTALTCRLYRLQRELSGVIGIGVVGIFSLLFIGRFFGGLSTSQALTICLAPLLCWVPEIPALKSSSFWRAGIIRLAIASIPLLIILALAKAKFDRETAPLLGWANVTASAPRGELKSPRTPQAE